MGGVVWKGGTVSNPGPGVSGLICGCRSWSMGIKAAVVRSPGAMCIAGPGSARFRGPTCSGTTVAANSSRLGSKAVSGPKSPHPLSRCFEPGCESHHSEKMRREKSTWSIMEGVCIGSPRLSRSKAQNELNRTRRQEFLPFGLNLSLDLVALTAFPLPSTLRFRSIHRLHGW